MLVNITSVSPITTQVVDDGQVYNVNGVPADVGIASLVFTLNVFAIYSLILMQLLMAKHLGLFVIVPVTDTPLVL